MGCVDEMEGMEDMVVVMEEVGGVLGSQLRLGLARQVACGCRHRFCCVSVIVFACFLLSRLPSYLHLPLGSWLSIRQLPFTPSARATNVLRMVTLFFVPVPWTCSFTFDR